MIFGRQPAFWIGLILSIVVAVLSALTKDGLISEAVAGKVTDAANALAQLATILAPVSAGLLIRTQVTPVASPALPVGTAVTTPTGPATVVAAPPAS